MASITPGRPTRVASPASASSASSSRQLQATRYEKTRAATMAIVAPLAAEDLVPQSMTEASPAKWHLAHTTWFFERFILRKFVQGYQPHHEAYDYLFNSYYNTIGPQHCRPRRGVVTRPTVEEVFAYRQAVDKHISQLLAEKSDDTELASLVETGMNHEQQHQELMVTDLKHLFSCNVLLPAMVQPPEDESPVAQLGDMQWQDHEGGVVSIGTDGDEGFAFDNEQPRHRVFLEPYQMAQRPVCNAEFAAFIDDGGYRRPELWLSMGWAQVNAEDWQQPLYWFRKDGQWRQFTSWGSAPLRPDEPACHLSYFEADAYARWAGARLPTEFEWEHAARDQPLDGVSAAEGRFHPTPLDAREQSPMRYFGDVWEWTSSSYGPYPGFKTPQGALGEYNGKFMCNQYVLRGGSCATAPSQIRLHYRNFFPPESRWQFAGIRLARSV